MTIAGGRLAMRLAVTRRDEVTMIWLAVVVVAIAVLLVPVLWRRGSRRGVLASEPLSTMNLEMSKRDRKKRAALDAASAVLK